MWTIYWQENSELCSRRFPLVQIMLDYLDEKIKSLPSDTEFIIKYIPEKK